MVAIEMIYRRRAIDQSARLYSPPSAVFPISDASADVRFVVGERMFAGNDLVLPITIATASASPSALESPRIIPVKIPALAAGIIIACMTCHLVAPSPYAAVI